MSEAWIDKDELARRLGLVKDGKPQTFTIGRKAASGEWDSHLVNGQLRFSPSDVAAIEKKLRHPALRRRQEPAPEPAAETRSQRADATGKRTTRRSTRSDSATPTLLELITLGDQRVNGRRAGLA